MDFERLKLEVYSILRRLFNLEQEIKTTYEEYDRAFDVTKTISIVTCPFGDVTASLPTAESVKGKMYTIKKYDAINQVDIVPNGVETIDGFPSASLTLPLQVITIYSNGTEWFLISTG